MPRRVLTKKEERIILENYLSLSSRQLAEKLKCSRTFVQRFLNIRKLKVPAIIIKQFRIKAMTGRTSFTKAEDEKIRTEYLVKPIKVIAADIGKSWTGVMRRIVAMKLTLPQEVRDERKQSNMFKKGQSPINKGKTWNEFMTIKGQRNSRKTCFKKGQLAHNKKPLGSMRVTKDGYLEIKILEPNKWQAYHRLMWEETFGPIPKGGVVRFVTSDKMNVHPFNLELIDQKKHMTANSLHRYPKEISRSIQLRGALNRQINKHLKRLTNEK